MRLYLKKYKQTNKQTNRMATSLALCWSMTINNPDENDWVLVRRTNGDFIREICHQLEAGEKEETPHIQAYLKLNKQQRLSYVKKLFPRGNFKAITNDEYKQRCLDYVQKQDDTRQEGLTIHTYNEGIPDVIAFLRKIVQDSVPNYDPTKDYNPDYADDWMDLYFRPRELLREIDDQERLAVVKRPSVAKLLVSPTYTRVKKLYLREIVENIILQEYTLRNANDDTREGTGQSELHETKSTGSTDHEEEEEQEDDSEADSGFDSGSEEDSEQED